MLPLLFLPLPMLRPCLLLLLFPLLKLMLWPRPVMGAKYPNEIMDTPIVQCEQESIVVKIRTTSANPSHIYAEDFHETPKCMVRNQNRIAFGHNECGMTMEKLDNPAGTMFRICLSVQIHPLFVTDSDRSYCAQCVYMDANLVDDLERNIAISEMMPNELDPQFDEASNPQCSYSIRKGTVDGPEVHAAVVGETVFHVWQCNNENVGILVQNCHVEDLQGDKILIIDQNGCGVDQYLFRTPQYSNDLHTAFLQSSVFKFVDKSMTRFRCQLRLCVKNRGKGCLAITPPSDCPSIVDPSGTDADAENSAVHGAGAPPSLGFTQAQAIAIGSPPSIGRIEPPASAAGPLVNGGTVPIGPYSTPRAGGGDGPPSIRPYGPGTTGKLVPSGAQIVSGGGKTTEASSYPYVLRNRRSATLMLYGTGTAARTLAAPLRSERVRRQSGNLDDGVVQELDVVGLIRVLDNPDDIQYFDSADHKERLQTRPIASAASSTDRPAAPMEQRLPPVSEELLQDPVQVPELADGTATTCVSTGTFWTLLTAFALLASLQLCAVAMVLMDRFLFGGTFVSRRVRKVLGE